MPGARCARSLVCSVLVVHTSVVTTVTPEITRHSLRNGFNGVFRALPGDEFVLSPSSADEGLSAPGRSDLASADLTPATGARTTRVCRTLHRRSSARRLIAHGPKPALRLLARPTLPRPPHPAPYVRDDRETPLSGRESRGVRDLNWVKRKME